MNFYIIVLFYSILSSNCPFPPSFTMRHGYLFVQFAWDMPPQGEDWKQPTGWLNIPHILMSYIFSSWWLGIFSCAKNTRLLNFWESN